MIHPRVTLHYMQTDAMRMADVIQPASFVTPDGFHDECVISLPVPYRVSPIPRIRRVLGVRAHVRGKWPPVGENFAPRFVVLKELEHPVRHLCERNSPGHENHGAWEPQRITRLVRVIRFRDEVIRPVLMGTED